jgi:aspartate/methionine/tyrosine aminotransferase
MPRSASDLSGDQPVQPLDTTVAEAAARALESGQTHYVDVPGIAPLREATARLLADQGAACKAGNVLITAGVQESRFLALQILGEHHGPIAIPAVVHPGVRQALGARDIAFSTIAVDESAGMLVDLAALRDALAAGARLIYLEAPVRLTGATYSRDALRTIAALAAEHEAGLVIDQGLAPWAAEPSAGAVLAAEGFHRLAVIGELAPGVGLQSWQIGYIATDEAWLPPIQSQKQIMAICTCTASQYAALEAMEQLADVWAGLGATLRSSAATARAAAAARGFNPLPGTTGSVLAVRAPDGASTTLEAAGYRAADGAAFGAPGVLRLAVPAGQDLAVVFATLSEGGRP